MPETFPEDVRRFIAEYINSVEQLEVLLLLREDRGRSWNAESVSHALSTQPAAALMRLNDLCVRQFLTREAGPEPRFRYAPASSELDDLAARLAAVYKERRVAVIAAIYSKPHDQVQAFADAFRLRKDK